MKDLPTTECSFGLECYRMNPDHFAHYLHPHLMGDSLPQHDSKGITVSQARINCWNNQKKIISKLFGNCTSPSGTKNANSLKRSSSGSEDAKSSEEKIPKIEEKPKSVNISVHSKIVDDPPPLRLYYNKVKDSPETRNDRQSLYFSDLLHPSLGILKSSLQLTFMVELDWLMMNYEIFKSERKPLTVLYDKIGSVEDEDGLDLTEKYPNLNLQNVKPKYPYGTHHSKVMVFVYEDDSVRIVISTSNLIGGDWMNRSQGLWVSPRCPKSASDSGTDSPTNFKRDLTSYLESYEMGSHLRPFVEAIRGSDMSTIDVFFLCSVPGSYDVANSPPKYGQAALEKTLRSHADPALKNWPVTMQCSSIGSLGKSYEGSFLEELAISLNACCGQSFGQKPLQVNFVYPTVDNVIASYGGAAYGCGCLPYGKSTHDKQRWFEDHMFKWKADNVHRTRAIPHIKTYTKVHEGKVGYFVLTSANLSKAAWGSFNKDRSRLFIKSHEAGVLFLPKFTHGKSRSYKLNSEITLPYDFPLTKYDKSVDVPFYHDI